MENTPAVANRLNDLNPVQTPKNKKITSINQPSISCAISSTKKCEKTPISSSNSSEYTPRGRPNPSTLKSKNPFTPIRSNSSFSSPTMSVSSVTKEAARVAKIQMTQEKIAKVAALKEQWTQEKKERIEKHKKIVENEKTKLQNAMEITALQRQKNLEKQKEFEMKKKQAEKELLANSLIGRSQLAKDLELQEKERRRKSIMINREILQAAVVREQEKKRKQKELEDSYLFDRRIDYLQLRENKKIEEEKRRESLAMRGEAAQRAKIIEEKNKFKELEKIQEIVEVRKDLLTGKDDIKKEEEERKRQSLAVRREEWLNHKNIEKETRQKEMEKIQDELRSRREDWLDVSQYKQEQLKAERESLEQRLEAWRHQNNAVINNSDEAEAAQYEAELRRQERQDVLNYQLQMESIRRQSLVYRAETSKKHQEWEQQQKLLLLQKESKEREIQAAEREDIQRYELEQENARRESLAFRIQHETMERAKREGHKSYLARDTNNNMELYHADKAAIEQAKCDQRDHDRMSLANRLVESRKKKKEELEKHRVLMNAMHHEIELRRLEWLDVKQFKETQLERGRKSIALRLDSWKQQRMKQEMSVAKQKIIAEENARLRAEAAAELRELNYAKKSSELVQSISDIKLIF